MSGQWDDSWLTATEARAIRADDAERQRERDALKLAVMAAWEAEIPQRSPIGTAIGMALGFALMVLGVVLAVTHQPMSGATVAGVLLICMGGAVAVRIAWVTR